MRSSSSAIGSVGMVIVSAKGLRFVRRCLQREAWSFLLRGSLKDGRSLTGHPFKSKQLPEEHPQGNLGLELLAMSRIF